MTGLKRCVGHEPSRVRFGPTRFDINLGPTEQPKICSIVLDTSTHLQLAICFLSSPSFSLSPHPQTGQIHTNCLLIDHHYSLLRICVYIKHNSAHTQNGSSSSNSSFGFNNIFRHCLLVSGSIILW